MNILELCVVPALGGLELYFHRCCVALQKRGHQVVSVRLAGSRLEELAIRDQIPVNTFKKGNKIFPLSNAKKLSRIIVEEKIDVVHAHHKDDLPLVALVKRLCPREFQLVFTRQMPMKHKKKDPYHYWLYSKIDLFITITELLKRDALEKLPVQPERITRLYYGVAPPPPRDQIFLDQFLTISSQGDFNIGVFSRLEHQKGQHLVIDAVAELIKRKVPAKLYVVGDPMSAEYKKTLIQAVEKHSINQSVTFKGFLQHPILAMMGMDVLILPSRNEAFGLVVIEAMRCGVAVMGVGAGGVPEIIEHEETGLLFEWDNIPQLADQLEFLFKDPTARKRMAARGKEKADREFDYNLHFERLENLFAGLLKKDS